jgi:chromate reductase, NAD(P)H dehydrogenase (quinone)
MPGALKLFIDYWTYPKSFEARPVAFVGLGGRFGGLRPVEHLQQVFGYRNAYIFPVRIFISDVFNTFKDGELKDPKLMDLVKVQVEGFCRFVRALQSESLDANSVLHPKAPPMP